MSWTSRNSPQSRQRRSTSASRNGTAHACRAAKDPFMCSKCRRKAGCNRCPGPCRREHSVQRPAISKQCAAAGPRKAWPTQPYREQRRPCPCMLLANTSWTGYAWRMSRSCKQTWLFWMTGWLRNTHSVTCSGLDTCVPVMQHTLAALNARFDVSVSTRHVFIAEKGPSQAGLHPCGTWRPIWVL